MKKILLGVMGVMTAASVSFGSVVEVNLQGDTPPSSVSFDTTDTVTGLTGVDTLVLTFDTAKAVSGVVTNFRNVNASGLSVDGGPTVNSYAWFDVGETFHVTAGLYNGGASGTEVTSKYKLYLTAAKVQSCTRFAREMTLEGGTGDDSAFEDGDDGLSSGTIYVGTLTLDSPYWVDGNTITFGRTGNNSFAYRVRGLTYDVVAIKGTVVSIR